ncbi:MAG: T9SS type A sorting domain-containing protein [Rhodothermales bacterium]|nr:T9SS type A sorting domain-containing protein [Rhodothermales bacterium]
MKFPARMYRSIPLFLAALVTWGAADLAAQTACEPGQAEALLDVNDVRARIFNNGNLFRREDPHVYEVPKGMGTSALFTAGLWLGGQAGGAIRASGTNYHTYEFAPGPLGADGSPLPDCEAFDRIYQIDAADLRQFEETGQLTEDLRDWPHDLGAPVIDGDGIAANYNLGGGDRPAILGHRMLWWIMNDGAAVRRFEENPPLPVEVRASAFALASDAAALDQATFYRYRIRYRGTQPLDSAYVGLFVDPDLGHFGDDYVGADTTLNLGFAYNADDADDRDQGGYGAAPPAVGIALLQGPRATPDGRDNDRDGTVDEAGERHGMTTFVTSHLEVHEMARPGHIYRSLRGVRPNGPGPIRAGMYGSGDGAVTTIMFPGDPVTRQYWSEVKPAPEATQPLAPGDRMMLVGAGPFTMQPGEEQEVVFAIVWARGADHLDSVTRLRAASRAVHAAFDAGLDTAVTTQDAEAPGAFALFTNGPNPFHASTEIRFALPAPSMVRLEVFDVLGRRVAVLVDRRLPAGRHAARFDATGLGSGVYLYRIEAGAFRETRTMLLLK